MEIEIVLPYIKKHVQKNPNNKQHGESETTNNTNTATMPTVPPSTPNDTICTATGSILRVNGALTSQQRRLSSSLGAAGKRLRHTVDALKDVECGFCFCFSPRNDIAIHENSCHSNPNRLNQRQHKQISKHSIRGTLLLMDVKRICVVVDGVAVLFLPFDLMCRKQSPVEKRSDSRKDSENCNSNNNTITSVETLSANERIRINSPSSQSKTLIRSLEIEDLDVPQACINATSSAATTLAAATNKDDGDKNHTSGATDDFALPPLPPPPLNNPIRTCGTIDVSCAPTTDIAFTASAPNIDGTIGDDGISVDAFSNDDGIISNNILSNNHCNDNYDNVNANVNAIVNANTTTTTTTTTTTAPVVRMSDDQSTQRKRMIIDLSPLDSILKGNERKRLKRPPKKYFCDTTEMVLAQGIRLRHPNDSKHLNSLHCFVQSELLEIFVLKPGAFSNSKKHNVVGIRCTQCGTLSKKERGKEKMAVVFPKSVQDLYRGVW
jgi:hypothetical protein